MQEFCDISAEAKGLEHPQPVVLIRGSAQNPREGYLVIENTVMSKIKIEELPIVLFAAYYVFNIEYCVGTRNFYQFLEIIFLNVPVPKTKTRLNHLLNMLDNVVQKLQYCEMCNYIELQYRTIVFYLSDVLNDCKHMTTIIHIQQVCPGVCSDFSVSNACCS